MLLCLHPGCGHPLAAQPVNPGSHESPIRALGAAPGSFLRLPSQGNATAEEGPAAAAWRELQALHPDVARQDQGRYWVSIWVPVSELQVSLYGFGVLGFWVFLDSGGHTGGGLVSVLRLLVLRQGGACMSASACSGSLAGLARLQTGG